MMLDLHSREEICDETLLLFGMSGDLPDPEWFHTLSEEERAEYWSRRMEDRLGEDWREQFKRLPRFLRKVVKNKLASLWIKDGF
jgi:hypothetical protein